MKRKMNVQSPLWLSLIIYWLLTFALLGASLEKTDGHFGYPIDDTYIHMAIAKHFVNDGYWGVSQNGFSSSTSSPLWTFILAITYKLVGVNDWTPFVLCLLLGSIIIIFCNYLLQKVTNRIILTAFLVFIVAATPLPILTLLGMEHVLHSLLTIGLIYYSATYLRRNGGNSRQFILLLLLAGLAPITRYESVFLVFSIVLLALTKKRFWAAFGVGVAGLLPVTIYGIFSTSQGWYFLPNSVLLKGYTPVFTIKGMVDFLLYFQSRLVATPHILVLVVVCIIIYLWIEKQKISGEKEKHLIGLFVLMTILHMQFADIGWFYRYEAYLVLTGCVILLDMTGLLITDHPTKAGEIFNYLAVTALVFLFALPFALRAETAFIKYPTAVMNIYEQQYQMGLFLKNFYSGKTVVANDIGAINYLANIKTLDLSGLGSMEVARARRNGSFYSNINIIDGLVSKKNADIVIVFRSVIIGNIPSGWVEIGRWQISHNVICAENEVLFYAPNTSLEKDVIANLREFSNSLPSTVVQSGLYMEP